MEDVLDTEKLATSHKVQSVFSCSETIKLKKIGVLYEVHSDMQDQEVQEESLVRSTKHQVSRVACTPLVFVSGSEYEDRGSDVEDDETAPPPARSDPILENASWDDPRVLRTS